MWFKGRAALAIDAWYSSGDVKANLELAREVLQSGASFDNVIADLDARARSDPAFVYPLGGGRLQGPSFEKVMRRGYLEAIALALDRPHREPPVPVRTYWMTGAGNAEFEMHVTDEAEQVSVTLCVPEIEGGAHDARDPESWVVTLEDGEAQVAQTSGPGDLQPPSARPLYSS
jgi:hypothetical protein